MKNAYRRFLVITIVVLSAFLVVVFLRKISNNPGLLELLQNKVPAFADPSPQAVTLRQTPALREREVSILNQMNNEFAKISSAVMPSVVSINTAGQEKTRVRDSLGRISTLTEATTAQGSGVIVSKQGHTLTNYHVVAGKEEINVHTADGKTYMAKVIGTDSALDIAVLKIQSDATFQALSFGDSDAVREGNIVLAFGNPFGIGKSITQGVISARERSISDRQGGLLQSSAAINPGYSGGPLVNIYGEIIGINSSIFSNDEKSPGFQGISFSIPSNIAKRTFLDILKRGRPVRGFLGVSFAPLQKSTSDALGYTKPYGALIQEVGPNTPAAKAGLQKNDIITHYGKHAVRDPEQLIGYIQRSEVGKPVQLKIWRNNTEVVTHATLEEFNKNLAVVPRSSRALSEQILRKMGIVVTYLNTEHRRIGISGVRVTRVLEGTNAEGIILPNDIIYQVNQYRINQPAEFYDLIAMTSTKQTTEVFVIRDGKVLSQPITIPAISL